MLDTAREARRPTSLPRSRLILIAALLALSATLCLVRLSVMMVGEHSQWLTIRNRQDRRLVKLPGIRGAIRDDQGIVLAASANIESVAADPCTAIRSRDYLDILAAAVHESVATIASRIPSNHCQTQFSYVKKNATPHEIQAVHDLALPGVYTIPEVARLTPLANITLGILGHPPGDPPLDGVESWYDSVLAPSEGHAVYYEDPFGRIMRTVSLSPPTDGQDITTTLDRSSLSSIWRWSISTSAIASVAVFGLSASGVTSSASSASSRLVAFVEPYSALATQTAIPIGKCVGSSDAVGGRTRAVSRLENDFRIAVKSQATGATSTHMTLRVLSAPRVPLLYDEACVDLPPLRPIPSSFGISSEYCEGGSNIDVSYRWQLTDPTNGRTAVLVGQGFDSGDAQLRVVVVELQHPESLAAAAAVIAAATGARGATC